VGALEHNEAANEGGSALAEESAGPSGSTKATRIIRPQCAEASY
jgi:hypothetical protein